MNEQSNDNARSQAEGNFRGRGHIATEQRLDASRDLDALSVRETLELINSEDQRVAQAVQQAIPRIEPVVQAAVGSLQQGGRLIYIGAGTSGRLGVLDASECPPTFHTDPSQVVGIIAGGDGALRVSSEGKEDDPMGAHAALNELQVGERDTLVGIAAGGTTLYVLGALAEAKSRGAATALLCCVPREQLPANDADHVIAVPVGPEVVTGSTRMKAGTATKLVLNMISTATMNALGKTWGHLMVDVRVTNQKLRDRAERILMQQLEVDRATAADLLHRAGDHVKPALVMGKLHCSMEEAQAKLDQNHGQLRPLLGAPR